MRFGVDFGTTRTVAAAVDRGNYPVVPVVDRLGDSHDFIPSVVAVAADGELTAGWEAAQAATDNFVRSFKRVLGDPETTPQTPVRLGGEARPLGEVLVAFARTVVEALTAFQRQAGEHPARSPEIVLGVPAHAGSAQRLLTMDAFSRAGADVLGLVNEPSAAAFEYTHRHGSTLNSKRNSIIVYDLGGGTFDATLLRIDGPVHHVEKSLGINRLGGDDFDEVLLGLALKAAGRGGDALSQRIRARLIEEARSAKENIKPQTRRVLVDLGEGGSEDVVVVPVDEFYAGVEPLVDRTLDQLSPLIGHGSDLSDTEIAGVYLVGGASSLPLVARRVRERFGRRVHRSSMPTAATAVGLAIAADPDSSFALNDRIARGIGVFRELESGRAVSFDPLVYPGAAAGADGWIRTERTYRAAHNVGWFRYVEYAAVDDDPLNPGDLSLLTEVAVGFTPELAGKTAAELGSVPVERIGHGDQGPLVHEEISVDPDGIATVRISVDGQPEPVVATSSRAPRAQCASK